MHFNAEAPKNLPIGFLLEVSNSKNEVKGYFYGSPHLAQKKMSGALQNEKIQDIFKKTAKCHFENIKNYLDDISATTGLSRIELREKGKLSAALIEIENSPENFFSHTTFHDGRFDEELEITRPGMDFHLLGEAYLQGKTVTSLEDKKASLQDTATESDIPKFMKNLQRFFEGDQEIIESFLEEIKGGVDQNISDEEAKQLVKELQQAWKEGDTEKFLETLNKFPGDFVKHLNNFNELLLSNKSLNDYNAEAVEFIPKIAFQRSREVDLARKVHEKLISEPAGEAPQFFVFGINHLVSQDHISLVALLAAKGWQFKQIT